ncbi:hypothetical protein BCU83_08440 [Vibrio breoganii]|nr:hypothetical protein BCV00_14000 [Vibrio breoganii]PMG32097.1 hypothetical protein BCU93_06420 [Vibrio breoganii]PMG82052.1 hypothetical protein BCU83_08440 [Vibrio breoganii]TKG28586.1 hypothetical protein FCV87_08965 [Vibrio breoganii]
MRDQSVSLGWLMKSGFKTLDAVNIAFPQLYKTTMNLATILQSSTSHSKEYGTMIKRNVITAT